jgi:hypothetical protein
MDSACAAVGQLVFQAERSPRAYFETRCHLKESTVTSKFKVIGSEKPS